MKNEIINSAKKNLNTGEEIINTIEGRPILNVKFDLNRIKIIGLILLVISFFTFLKSTEKINWGKEMTSKHGPYWNEPLENNTWQQNRDMWQSAESNYKTRKNTYVIISTLLFISSLTLLIVSLLGNSKDYYFITNQNRVLIVKGNLVIYFKIEEINSYTTLDNNKFKLVTNIGETFKIDKVLKDYLESEKYSQIYKS